MQFVDPHDWRALYPFCSRHLELNDVRLHYLDEGRGQPLLMVHGNPTWSFYWRNLVLALRGDRRAVVPDHIGCGLSDKPASYPYCLQQHIDNLVQLVESLNLQDICLLAHDWGGAIGLGTALRMPERFTRLILFNTGAFPPPFVPWRIRVCRMPYLGAFAVRGLNLFCRAALTMATEKPDRLTPAIRNGLLVPYDSWSNRVGVYGFVRDIPLSPAHPTWRVLESIESGLKSLSDRPTQFLWGMRDWCFTPACLERLAANFPDAEIHGFEDAGHYVVEDAVDRIIPAVRRFLGIVAPAG